MDGVIPDHVDLSAETPFQLLLETDLIQEAGALLKRHEEVEVAASVKMTPADGAENPNVLRVVSLGRPQDHLSLRLHDSLPRSVFRVKRTNDGSPWHVPQPRFA